MPPLKRPLEDPVGEIWERNESLIRRLYEAERKSLKEVKHIMEREHGFPNIPLSTYETKLRDELGLRKKLKKGDWHAVYQHHLSSGGKHTGVYLNGTKIPWKKAWKEIRRSGARSTSEHRDAILPAGVIVRTPSPPGHLALPLMELNQNNSTDPSHPSLQQLVLMQHSLPTSDIPMYNSQDRTQLAGGYLRSSASVQGTCVSGFLRVAFEKNSVALENIPWIMFTEAASAFDNPALRIPSGCNETSGSLFKLGFMGGPIDVEIRRSVLLSNIYPCSNATASYSAPALNFDTYHFLTGAIYHISNKFFHNPNMDGPYLPDECPDMIHILLDRIPHRLLGELFQSDLLTIRATWEFLARCAGSFCYRETFKFLMHIGLRRPEWILLGGAAYLSYAASMGIEDITRALLKVGVRADDKLDDQSEMPAIIEAAATGNLEIMKLLVENCDIDRVMFEQRRTRADDIKHSNFSLFLSTLAAGKYFTTLRRDHGYLRSSSHDTYTVVYCGLNYESQRRALSILLDHGANVDLPWEGSPILDLSEFRPRSNPKEWRLTLLEQSYFWDIKLFDKLVPYSVQAKQRMIRPFIYRSAKQGKEALCEYLKLAGSNFNMAGFLEFVLAELFEAQVSVGHMGIMEGYSLRAREIDVDVIRGLLEFGVDPNLPSLPLDINYLLYNLVQKRSKYGCSNGFSSILELLLRLGAVIDSEILKASVERVGVDTLLLLSQHGALVSRDGAAALVAAACFDNYEAVSWLLEAGVDINATIDVHSERWSVLALISTGRGAGNSRWEIVRRVGTDPASCEMLSYLIDHGAALKINPEDVTAFQFLCHIIGKNSPVEGTLYDRLKLFLEKSDSRDLVDDKNCLYGAYLNRTGFCEPTILELLYKHGVPIKDGSVLPTLIRFGDSPELIQNLLEAGTDIHAYSGCTGPTRQRYSSIQAAASRGDTTLVEQLLHKGADINQHAHYSSGRTALQAACEWDAHSIAEKAHKVKIVQYLLEKGAEVNAPPAKEGGLTALQIAAMDGNMEVAVLLVQAGANPNARSAKNYRLCALDGAVRRGRLDMVQFLLNVGALSHFRGETGYDGAIKLAKPMGHYTVIDLIRRHVENDERLFGGNLAMTFQDEMQPGELDVWNSSYYSDVDGEETDEDEAVEEETGEEDYMGKDEEEVSDEIDRDGEGDDRDNGGYNAF